jgi:hypothetical protein
MKIDLKTGLGVNVLKIKTKCHVLISTNFKLNIKLEMSKPRTVEIG